MGVNIFLLKGIAQFQSTSLLTITIILIHFHLQAIALRRFRWSRLKGPFCLMESNTFGAISEWQNAQHLGYQENQ